LLARRSLLEDQRYMVGNLVDLAMQWCRGDYTDDVVKCGRKHDTVDAHIEELMNTAENIRVDLDPYRCHTATTKKVRAQAAGFLPIVCDEVPFPAAADLGSCRLEPFLDPGLWMGFVNPLALKSWPLRRKPWPHARRRRLNREDLGLALKWDAAGRLGIVRDIGHMRRA